MIKCFSYHHYACTMSTMLTIDMPGLCLLYLYHAYYAYYVLLYYACIMPTMLTKPNIPIYNYRIILINFSFFDMSCENDRVSTNFPLKRIRHLSRLEFGLTFLGSGSCSFV